MARAGYRALLIGNSTFPTGSSNLPALDRPGNGVAELRAALADPLTGLFDGQSERALPDRTITDVLVVRVCSHLDVRSRNASARGEAMSPWPRGVRFGTPS